MNYRFRRKILPPVAHALAVSVAIAPLVTPITARAQFAGKAAATVQYESNSNVYDLSSGLSQPGTNGPRRGDSFLAYQEGFDVKYLWGLQEIYASASTTESKYQHFTELDHNDYKLGTGLNWKFGQRLDGKLDVTRTRSMVQFLDLQGTALSVDTVQRESAQIGLGLPSDWRLEGTTYTSTLKEPVPATPDLQLKETSGTAAVKYQGISGFTFGFDAGYTSGGFQGTNGIGNSNYSQSMEDVLASYQSGHSTIDSQVGYTRRTSASGANNASGVTGNFGLSDKLTPKTGISVKLSRVLNSYVASAGTEIDTGAALGVNWQATYKLNVSLGYTFTYRDFSGQGNDPLGSARIDHQQSANMGISYQAQRWLLIRPYANVQTRRSNIIGGDFNSNTFGVIVTASTPDAPR